MGTNINKNRTLWLEIGLLALSLIASLYIAFSPTQSVLNWYSSDDAFYYFKVAENVVTGHGLTFDGINPTNGFHPLWMLICIPIFWLAQYDLILPLRLLVVISSMLNAAAGILLARLLRRVVSAWIAAFAAILWIFAPSIHGVATQQGLEGAINTFTLMLLLYLVISRQAERLKIRRVVICGLVAGLAVLARLDNIFLVLIIGVWYVIGSYPAYIRTVILGDLGLIFSAGMLSYFVRLDAGITYIQNSGSLPFLLGLSLILYPLAFLFSGLYRPPEASRIKKYILLNGITSSVVAVIIGLVLIGCRKVGFYTALPRLVIFIDGVVVIVGSFIVRFVARFFYGIEPICFPSKPNWFSWEYWKTGIKKAVAYFSPLVLLLGSYMVWSYLRFGLWTPVSGQVKRWWGELPYSIYGHADKNITNLLGFNENGAWSLALSPITYVQNLITGILSPEIASLLALILICGLALGLLLLNRKRIVRLADEMGLFAWFIGIYAHIFSYTSTSYVNFRSWYWISEMLFLVVLAAVLLECINSLLNKRNIFQISIWGGFLILLCAGNLGLFANMVIHRFPYRAIEEQEVFTVVQAIEAHTEPGSLIGLTGSGGVGYFLKDRTVVNLDGLINSPEYFRMLRSGQGDLFLDRMGLDYVFGNPIMLLATEPYQRMFVGRLEPVAECGSNLLYHYPNR